MNLHYGSGLDIGEGWFNCDASPTLRLQRLPVIGLVFQKLLRPRFPDRVHYGDIVRGVNVAPGSCDAIYCSHILEHLALEDMRIALRHTHECLKSGGIFRVVVPDFAQQVDAYLSNSQPEALSNFLGYTFLGRAKRPRGVIGFFREFFGNSHHLWMWDEKGLALELRNAGLNNIRRCQPGDSINSAFLAVENPDRFNNWGLAMECRK